MEVSRVMLAKTGGRRMGVNRWAFCLTVPVAALLGSGVIAPSVVSADTNVYGRMLPSDCNYQSAPSGGCVIATRRGATEITILPFGPPKRVVKVWRNGAFYGKYRLTNWNDVTIPRRAGTYSVTVKFTAPRTGTTYAKTRFRLS